MKILMVSEDIPRPQLGGLARHVVVLANALIDAGHEVVLMGVATPSYEDCAREVGFRGRFIAGFDGLEAGWKEVSLGYFNPWKREFMAARIARAIQAHAPGMDVVHYHGHYPMVNLGLPADLPFVQSRHDQGSECLTHMRFRGGDVCRETDPRACAGCIHPRPGPLRTAVSAAAVRRYRRLTAEAFARHDVVFVSDFLRRQFQRAVPQAALERSHVIPAFIDEAARVEPVVAAHGGTVIHVAGRLTTTKGIVDFIRLLKPVLPPGWRVNVFGDGPQRDDLIALCDERIVWHGHRPTAEVMQSSSSASVAVVPSLCEEAWGAVTAEALRFGVPCYALDRGGTPELARYAAPGQLRLFDDLPALVRGLVQDPIPAHRLGGESADVRARLPELLALYEKVREQVRQGPP